MSIDGGLRSLFHDRLREGFHWQAVETGGTGRGIPDSNYCTLTSTGVSVEGWVEFKQTEAWAVGMRTEQVAWHLTRARRGGRTYVAVRRWHDGGARRGDAVDELWVYPGVCAPALLRSGLRCSDWLLLERGGPSRWDWDRVRSVLLS